MVEEQTQLAIPYRVPGSLEGQAFHRHFLLHSALSMEVLAYQITPSGRSEQVHAQCSKAAPECSYALTARSVQHGIVWSTENTAH